MNLDRHRDWEPRLREYLASVRGTTFRYGRMDCALFVAGAVEAMTGVDLAAPYRGQYHDQTSAEALLDAHGGLEGLVTEILGEPMQGLLSARKGDVVLGDWGFGDALGLCDGSRVIYLASYIQAGPERVKLDHTEFGAARLVDCRRAWHA